MFYCEKCREAAEWPGSIVTSLGPCEICEEVTVCYDRPSRSLPVANARLRERSPCYIATPDMLAEEIGRVKG